ncbi:MAG: hypothetical protein OQL16_12290 [Gammaproteobacteria bacterium]|nr:hypothetical protein [Gammaproteobacteria bacterium]
MSRRPPPLIIVLGGIIDSIGALFLGLGILGHSEENTVLMGLPIGEYSLALIIIGAIIMFLGSLLIILPLLLHRL